MKIKVVCSTDQRSFPLQAQASAMGTWGRSSDSRRGWEGDRRLDLRSVANGVGLLPYNVAWQRGHREAAQILNPHVPIDVALENVRETDQGDSPLGHPFLDTCFYLAATLALLLNP